MRQLPINGSTLPPYVKQASLALELAQGRYNLGLSSIVELTQSQYLALQFACGQLR